MRKKDISVGDILAYGSEGASINEKYRRRIAEVAEAKAAWREIWEIVPAPATDFSMNTINGTVSITSVQLLDLVKSARTMALAERDGLPGGRALVDNRAGTA